MYMEPNKGKLSLKLIWNEHKIRAFVSGLSYYN